ncbi:MAG TPA: DUF4112 domain-containing protein [Caulobacteraceae bacterium]|jgi:hypothetical protein
MVARSIPELEKIWVALEHSKKFSDGLISIGGVGLLGVNGLIAFASSAISVPAEILFEAYTAITALYLLGLAISARASPGTIVKILLYIAVDAGLDIVPVFGGLADAVLRAPRMAAGAIQKEIEQTHWVDTSWREVRASGAYQQHLADMRAAGKRRVVFLRD